MSRHSISELRIFIQDVLRSFDVPQGDASVTADLMLEADIRGMNNHGIRALPAYAKRLQAGGYNVRPNIRTVKESPISALIDGDNGLGHIVMSYAVETGVAKARESGMAWVGVRGSNHAGAGGVYVAKAIEHGMIGLFMSVGNVNRVAPWGGADPLLGTNPIAIGIPSGNEGPLVLDMATSVVSYGQAKATAERDGRLPEGWVVDRRGNPITDPQFLGQGLLAPIGGYKGYGLALVVGIFAGVLNGAAFGTSVINIEVDEVTPTNTGHAFFVLNPDLFQPFGEFIAQMDRRLAEIRQSMPTEGSPEPIRIPGHRVPGHAADILKNGVILDEQLVAQLLQVANKRGVSSHPF